MVATICLMQEPRPFNRLCGGLLACTFNATLYLIKYSDGKVGGHVDFPCTLYQAQYSLYTTCFPAINITPPPPQPPLQIYHSTHVLAYDQ